MHESMSRLCSNPPGCTPQKTISDWCISDLLAGSTRVILQPFFTTFFRRPSILALHLWYLLSWQPGRRPSRRAEHYGDIKSSPCVFCRRERTVEQLRRLSEHHNHAHSHEMLDSWGYRVCACAFQIELQRALAQSRLIGSTISFTKTAAENALQNSSSPHQETARHAFVLAAI